jgi:GNAT superfamily N-acetyltransferase
MEHGDYFVSTDPGLIDLEFVCAALAGTYWAKSRPRFVVERSLKASLCFGLYRRPGAKQVGFARVVTDGATFSWLCDVVIDEGNRGMGLGKFLMSSVVGHPDLKGTTFLLGTRDAHGLYERYDFSRAEMMRRLPPNGMPNPPQTPSQEPPAQW